MNGQFTGLAARIMEVAPDSESLHFIIHKNLNPYCIFRYSISLKTAFLQ